MPLTTLTGSSADDPPSQFVLDFAASRLSFRGQTVRLNGKALSFLGLLAFARLQWDDGGKRSPWVTVEEIAKLPDWTAKRLRESLESQIRREVKKLARRGIDIIETEPGEKTKGPFRLKIPPDRGSPGLAALVETFASFAEPVSEQTPDALFDWLESSFDVWRNAFSFDKQETEMSMFEGLATRNRHKGPVISAMAFITQSRGFRETRQYKEAENSIRGALAVLETEKNLFIRSYLQASCHVQQGWTDYRQEKFAEAGASVEAALRILDGHPHLKVLGQVLTLKSFLHRRDSRFAEALEDLWTAAEYFLLELDLYNLFSVYHNLSCLLSEQATCEKTEERRQSLLEQAIRYCEKSKNYCDRFKVGQNSVISTIQLASLCFRLGDFPNAKREADEAFEKAKEIDNLYDLGTAHHHRMKVRLRLGDFPEADGLHAQFLESLGDHPERPAIDEDYKDMRRAAVAKRKKTGR